MPLVSTMDFSGSIIHNTDITKIGINQTPYMRNMVQDDQGNTADRLGSALYGADIVHTSPVQGAMSWKRPAVDILLVWAGGDLYGYSNDGAAYVLFSANVRSASVNVNAVQFKDTIYFTSSSPTEYLKSFDGASVATISGNIVGEFIATAQNRLFVGGDSNKIYYSEADTSVFDTTNLVLKTDETVTGLVSLGDQAPVIAFDRETMYILDAIDESVAPFKGFGCVNHRSISVVLGNIIWANKDGFYIFNPTMGRPEKISYQIENNYTLISIFNKITDTGFQEMASGTFRNQYYCSIGDLGSTLFGEIVNDAWVVIDPVKKVWTLRNYPDNNIGSVFTTHKDGSGDIIFLAGSKDGGAMFKVDVAATYTDEVVTFVDNSTGAGSTGNLAPSANGDDYTAWTNGGNVYTSNDVRAVSPLGTTGDPPLNVELSWNGGTNYTVTGVTSYFSIPKAADSDDYAQFGGSGDLWGRTWTAAETSDTNFRLKLTHSGDSHDFYNFAIVIPGGSIPVGFAIQIEGRDNFSFSI